MDNESGISQFLVNSFDDRYLYEVNGTSFNQIGSAALYQSHYGETLLQATRLYIIVGTDSGLLISYLKKQKRSELSRYLFVEAQSILERLRLEGLLENLPEEIAVVAPEELWNQAHSFKFQDYTYIEAVDFVEALCTVDGRFPEYRDLSSTIQKELQHASWSIRFELGSMYFIERQLENLAENRHAGFFLKSQFSGKTAVLLAGGPSLDDFLPWVKENRENVVILAVSRISRQLLRHNLIPDFIFSIDPQTTSFDVSREMLEMWDQAIFIHAYHVTPLLLGQWRGRSIYLGPRFPWNSPENPENLGFKGPTVANMALSAAVEMGFQQVIFAGIDLCYGANGITHAGGSNESAAGPRLGDTLSVPTNDGDSSETGTDYAAAITILKEQAKQAKKQGCQFINPAPRAAKIDFVDHMPLADISIEPMNCEVRSQICALLPSDGIQSRKVHYLSTIKELDRADEQLKDIARLSKEALLNNKKFFARTGNNSKYKRRMDKIEERLNQDFSNLSVLVKQYGIRNFLKIVRPNKEEPSSAGEMEELLRIYYQSYRDSANRLRGLVQNAKDRVQMRLEEDQAQPDFTRLATQWRRDNQPGRVLVWKAQQRQAKEQLDDPEVKNLFAELEAEFLEILAETETGQMKKVRKYRSLVGVRERALRYFQAKDEIALVRLSHGLDIHPDRTAAELLGYLVAGFRAELDGYGEEALNQYQKLVGDTFNILTEEALKRILSISLQDNNFEFALQSLECLANAAVVYMPKYAELLRILGRFQDAADVYTDYIEAVPTDLSAFLKLGQLYREMGEEHAAQTVFSLVLEQDPENEAAQTLQSVGQ